MGQRCEIAIRVENLYVVRYRYCGNQAVHESAYRCARRACAPIEARSIFVGGGRHGQDDRAR